MTRPRTSWWIPALAIIGTLFWVWVLFHLTPDLAAVIFAWLFPEAANELRAWGPVL